MPVGSSSTQLIILRGNSGSGKSSVAARLRKAYGRGVAIVPQDVVRRELVRERDRADAVNISLIDVMVRHILDNGVHVILEGIMYADRYGEMLTKLVREHAGKTFSYYFDVPYETTVERHWTKPNCHDWSPEDMREWYVDKDLLPGGIERIIGPDNSLEETAQRILAETHLLSSVRPPQTSFALTPDEVRV